LTTHINSQQQPPANPKKPSEEPKPAEEAQKTAPKVFFKAPVSSGKSVFKIAPPNTTSAAGGNTDDHPFAKFMRNI